jgi:hypothetical protein
MVTSSTARNIPRNSRRFQPRGEECELDRPLRLSYTQSQAPDVVVFPQPRGGHCVEKAADCNCGLLGGCRCYGRTPGPCRAFYCPTQLVYPSPQIEVTRATCLNAARECACAQTPTENSALKSDLLWGVAAIAGEIGLSSRQTHYLLENGKLPARKLGDRWHSMRSALRKHFAVTAEVG